MKKRLVIIGILFCFLFSLVACKSEENVDVVTEVSDSEADVVSEEVVEEESISEEEEEFFSDFEPQVLYDANGIMVKTNDYYFYTDEWTRKDNGIECYWEYPILVLEVTNNSEESYKFKVYDMFIDGIACNWYGDCALTESKEEVESGEYLRSDFSVQIESGETKIIYLRIYKWFYYMNELDDIIDLSIAFYLQNDSNRYYTNLCSINTICPKDSQGIIEMMQIDNSNVIFENDSVIIYLVQAETSVDEETKARSVECILMLESKIFKQSIEDNNINVFQFDTEDGSYFNEIFYLVEEEIVKHGGGTTSDKEIFEISEHTVENWDSVLEQGVYQIEYQQILQVWAENNGYYSDIVINEEGTIDIPVENIVFVTK